MGTGYEIRSLTQVVIREGERDFLAIAADVPGEYWTLENLLMDLPDKWCLSFGVWATDHPVAYAILSRKDVDEIHLHHFMVTPGFRRHGLGGIMVEEMEDRAREAGSTRLTLKVGSDNLGAQRFYARHGYIQSGRDGAYLVMSKVMR